MKGVANVHDVLAIETQGQLADLPSSTYEMICRGAAINPSAPALSFFATADDYRNAECWTYSELVRDVTRTANMFVSAWEYSATQLSHTFCPTSPRRTL